MSKSHTQLLKASQTRKSEISTEMNLIDDELHTLKKTKRVLSEKLQKLNREIKKLSNNKLIITEHAILRFLEREMGLDIKGIAEKIVRDLGGPEIHISTGRYPIREGGLRAIIKDNVIITFEQRGNK